MSIPMTLMSLLLKINNFVNECLISNMVTFVIILKEPQKCSLFLISLNVLVCEHISGYLAIHSNIND